MKLSRTALVLIGIICLLLTAASRASAQEFTFPVKHDHTFKSCKGALIINEAGIEYRTSTKDHARKWTYPEIRMIEIVSPKEIKVLTYESETLKLGRDRTFKFKLTGGELPRQVSHFLLVRVDRPLVTSFVATQEKAQYEIPARHRHRFGGDQGILRIFADRVVYQSNDPKSSRNWRWSDIRGISRAGPYQFSIMSYEPELGGPTRTFNFDLKERMDDNVYDYVWARVYKTTPPATSDPK